MTGPDDLAVNSALWTLINQQHTDSSARALWARDDIAWGLLATPESELGVIGDVAGRVVVELGCGTAHMSAWLTRRGARVVAVDLTAAQLRTAHLAQSVHRLGFALVQANAEQLPLVDGFADLCISEHGAPSWCDPELWVREAARVLRPGGRLVFLTNSPLSAMCVPADGGPAGDRLLRGPDELREVRWPGGGVEHHPSHGDWVRVLSANGFRIEGLLELPHAWPAAGVRRAPDAQPAQPPDRSDPTLDYYDIVDRDWAARWPVEDLWTAVLCKDKRSGQDQSPGQIGPM
ncbi:MAG: class I SAM-dependent methyltransferase [Candidatus Nanopelagicales bacterium]